MKYLKLFEDNRAEVEKMCINVKFKNKLNEFCDTYLAYLIDRGFTIQIKYNRDRNKVSGSIPRFLIVISRFRNDRFRYKFTWDDIKDEFIPFFDMLSREYNILDTTFSVYPKNPTPVIDYSRGTTYIFNELSITNKEILDDKVSDKLEKMELPKISWIKIKID